MKSHRETLTFEVSTRMDFVNITSEVESAERYGFDGRRPKRVLVKIIGE
jgi:hypothetical protein